MKKTLTLLLAFGTLTAVAQTKYELPPLPYANDALEPVMSAETIDYHHDKHVQAYVDNLNRLIPGTPYADATLEEISRTADGAIFNNGAQILNHTLFFDAFAPETQAKHEPTGKLAEAIVRDFGSFDAFKAEFAKAAGGVFGSGWAWLAADADGSLVIMGLPNAGNPIKAGHKPLLGVDVWEHSYYIDYRNRRSEYVDRLWRIVDWNVIEGRYGK